MKRLAFALCLFTVPAYAADAPPPQPQPEQAVPAACEKNVIILSVRDSRFLSARDANEIAADLCKQIVAKGQSQQPPAKH